MSVEFDDMDAIQDSRCLVHLHMTEALRRERYAILRQHGYNSYFAQRARDWHEREFRSALSVSPLSLSESPLFNFDPFQLPFALVTDSFSDLTIE